MDPTARRIRAFFKTNAIERAHVRVYADGETWVFAPTSWGDTRFAKRDAICASLNRAGYVAECTGAPGTAGDGIIKVRAVPII